MKYQYENIEENEIMKMKIYESRKRSMKANQ